MDLKKLFARIWGICLMIIGINSTIMSISGIFTLPLPDILVRILGISNLIALPMMIYSYVKVFLQKKK